MIHLVACMASNRVIGKDNELIWRLPEDLKHFKKVTSGNSIVMGRKTYESIGRPLPNRANYIITRDKHYKVEGCITLNSIDEVFELDEENLFIIGGSEIYKIFLPYTDKIHLTEIEDEFEGDAFFPEFDKTIWKETSKEKGIKNEKNPYDYYFYTYEK